MVFGVLQQQKILNTKKKLQAFVRTLKILLHTLNHKALKDD
jgi:hypothetical protein